MTLVDSNSRTVFLSVKLALTGSATGLKSFFTAAFFRSSKFSPDALNSSFARSR